ncbi:unnamed protein product [Alopecurus aequalis]
MASMYLLILLLATASSLSGVLGQTGVSDAIFYSNCSTTNYTDISPYSDNVDAIISSLVEDTVNNGGFNTTTSGEAPDMASVSGPMACVLRYSNESFFSIADLTIVFTDIGYPIKFITDVASMNSTRWKLMTQLAGKASDSELRFANGSQAYKDKQDERHVIYGMAQCTRDLNASECSRCLTKFVAELVTDSFFSDQYCGAVTGYSCYVNYQVDLELYLTIPTLPPRAEPPTPPLSTNPIPRPSSPLGSPPSTGRTTVIVTMVTVTSAVAVIISASLSVWFLLHRRRRKAMARKQDLDMFDEQPMEEEEFEKGTGPRRFSYNELALATKHFSDEEKLGEGGFGSVYRGYLKDADLHVAVKRISKGSRQGKNEYVAEVKIISRLRHRNLVQLIGWCHGGGELLLVYELMPNGSLDTHIHSQNNILPWPLRHEIVLGLGSALVYLHQEWEQCVLHRDIKPSNLMLDASFNVKLGDFGLARLVNHGQGSHTTKIAGTKGYMDPAECMITGRASTKSDVYSFGVVVLEIVCGRRPILVLRGNEAITMHLVQWVWDLYGDGRILDAADARLNGEFDGQEMERVMVAALWCTHPDMSLRPSIREAVNVMRFEAPLPCLPTKMPVATFVAPVQSLLSESKHVVTGRSGESTLTMQSTSGATTSSSLFG